MSENGDSRRYCPVFSDQIFAAAFLPTSSRWAYTGQPRSEARALGTIFSDTFGRRSRAPALSALSPAVRGQRRALRRGRLAGSRRVRRTVYDGIPDALRPSCPACCRTAGTRTQHLRLARATSKRCFPRAPVARSPVSVRRGPPSQCVSTAQRALPRPPPPTYGPLTSRVTDKRAHVSRMRFRAEGSLGPENKRYTRSPLDLRPGVATPRRSHRTERMKRSRRASASIESVTMKESRTVCATLKKLLAPSGC